MALKEPGQGYWPRKANAAGQRDRCRGVIDDPPSVVVMAALAPLRAKASLIPPEGLCHYVMAVVAERAAAPTAASPALALGEQVAPAADPPALATLPSPRFREPIRSRPSE